jgi:uncharacterized protein (TIGR03084 family)
VNTGPTDAVLHELRSDLRAEQEALDAVVDGLADDALVRPTDSPGWSVADQIAHLTHFDAAAVVAITEPNRFAELAGEANALFARGARVADEAILGPYRSMSHAALLDSWRTARQSLAEAAGGLHAGDRVPWYGPSMSARSFLTARLMETWAHGVNVARAVGAQYPATDRLRHITTLGVLTRGWSYLNRGRKPPDAEVHLALTAPSGAIWRFGDPGAAESVTGAAEDFCLVVTQRSHVDDTGLQVNGPAAREWMELAQCFAGPATDGPAKR